MSIRLARLMICLMTAQAGFTMQKASLLRAQNLLRKILWRRMFFTGGRIEALTKGLEKTLCEQKVFSLDYEPDLERTYKTILQGIRDYFRKKRAQKSSFRAFRRA